MTQSSSASFRTSSRRARRSLGQTGQSRWDIAIRSPAAPLRSFVRGDYIGYKEWSGALHRRREFPVPFAVMVIELGPPLRLYDGGDTRQVAYHRGGFVGGLCDTFVDCEHDGFQHGVQVNLTPIGARLLFDVPMSDISAQVVAIDDLLPARHRGLAERLADVDDWDVRFDLVDATLADCLHEASPRTAVVAWAASRIAESGGTLSIRELVRELGYSRKHVISLFRDQVGIPPKMLAEIVRFDRLFQHLRRGDEGSWSELALEYGFYDQAHMAREIRRFTGVTPSSVKTRATELSGLIP
jgi:AraC-like DNA-binding protein